MKANETCKIGGLTIILFKQEYDLLKLKIWCFLGYFVDLGTSQISPHTDQSTTPCNIPTELYLVQWGFSLTWMGFLSCGWGFIILDQVLKFWP